MYEKMKQLHDTEEVLERRVSMAGGIAEYDPELDQCFADVFKRADSIMYQKKTAMKQGNLE